MRWETPSEFIDKYPDLLSGFQGATNSRQREEYRRFLYRAIRTQLTKRQTQLMQMYYFQHMTMTEIAQELHINKATVSRTLSTAIRRLTELAAVYFDIKR